jgi:hypothetical protein
VKVVLKDGKLAFEFESKEPPSASADEADTEEPALV